MFHFSRCNLFPPKIVLTITTKAIKKWSTLNKDKVASIHLLSRSVVKY